MKTILRVGAWGFLAVFAIGAVQARESPRVFPVMDFEASGSGVTGNAPGIQMAIDAVTAAGGGVVLFPAGEDRTTAISLSLSGQNHRMRVRASSPRTCIDLTRAPTSHKRGRTAGRHH